MWQLLLKATGLLKQYALPVAFLAGAAAVSVVWYLTPSCEERVAMATLKVSREAQTDRERQAREIAILREANEHIHAQVRTRTVEVPVYRECKHPPDVVQHINRALEPR